MAEAGPKPDWRQKRGRIVEPLECVLMYAVVNLDIEPGERPEGVRRINPNHPPG